MYNCVAVIANEGKIPDEFSSCSSTSGGPYSPEQVSNQIASLSLQFIGWFEHPVRHCDQQEISCSPARSCCHILHLGQNPLLQWSSGAAEASVQNPRCLFDSEFVGI